MADIREIRRDEYEFLREMLYEAIYFDEENSRLPRSITFEPHLSKYVNDFGRPGDFAFGLVIDNQLVGAIWSRLFSEEDKGYGFVDSETPELSMAIIENYRNKGLGGQLLEKLFEELRSSGFQRVSLSVDKRNRAVDLYQRCGFETIAEAGTAYTMVKDF